LEDVDTLVVDKTGTLTEGRPELTEIRNLSEDNSGDDDHGEILALAAAVESKSEHPLAQAVLRRAEQDGVQWSEATEFDSTTGRGVRAKVDGREVLIGKADWLAEQGIDRAEQVKDQANEFQQEGATVVFVAVDGNLAAMMAISDPIKESTPSALRTLHKFGWKVVMLTGDAEPTARAVAKTLGIDEFHAGVSPEQKYDFVQKLKAEGRIVAMAGDGINDAPALAEANVGIAMGTGTGVAIESAGVTLVGGDLRGVAAAAKLSRKTMRNIRQNLFFAFVYNTLGIPIAAGLLYPFFGILLSPMIAAAAMSLSSVSVISNALRLRTIQLT